MRKPVVVLGIFAVALVYGVSSWQTALAQSSESLQLRIAAEQRCSPYDRKRDYRYRQSVEQSIVVAQGGIYSFYENRHFASTRQTDIEHIVALSEAHDSGLCSRSRSERARFASDLLNLTLASPQVNRYQKRHKDPGEWMPAHNRCWYAQRVVAVKQKYDLTVDPREARVLSRTLAQCDGQQWVIPDNFAIVPDPPARSGGALALYDTNGNGRISCAEAREARIAPVHRGHPAYRYMFDRDNDGVVCE